jgi:hypothetical protein
MNTVSKDVFRAFRNDRDASAEVEPVWERAGKVFRIAVGELSPRRPRRGSVHLFARARDRVGGGSISMGHSIRVI